MAAAALANSNLVNGNGSEKSSSKHKSKNQLRREKAKAKKSNNVKEVRVLCHSVVQKMISMPLTRNWKRLPYQQLMGI